MNIILSLVNCYCSKIRIMLAWVNGETNVKCVAYWPYVAFQWHNWSEIGPQIGKKWFVENECGFMSLMKIIKRHRHLVNWFGKSTENDISFHHSQRFWVILISWTSSQNETWVKMVLRVILGNALSRCSNSIC